MAIDFPTTPAAPSPNPFVPPTATLAEMRNLVRLNLGNRTDKDALIDAALNAGLRNARQRHRFKHTTLEQDLVLTPGVATLALPNGTEQVVELRLIDGQLSYQIDLTDKSTLVRRWPNDAAFSANRPVAAYEENGVLTFAPRPNSAYTVRITTLQRPQTMVLDTDTSGIIGIENALVAYATAHVMRSLEKFQEATAWDQRYEIELQSAVVADRRRPALKYRLAMHPEPGSNQLLEAFGSAFAGHRRLTRPWR